ncbi:gas vesicle protein [Rhodovulum sp. 12E13]|uniref:gas vesicle protein n=1 Tax=Rhodovulum sp. 12E13 TaxID=2203891 RepID=UPI000E193052|nr:gas vesicle protein [Rhodovulum sp. 12E13]RDC73190.1 gas vesicle protein [Rhodovulum sp. 12E13]
MAETQAPLFVAPDTALASCDTRLVDVVDRLLDRGVVIRGELWLTVAGVDLVFVGADLVLASPDTMRRTRHRPHADGARTSCGGAPEACAGERR